MDRDLKWLAAALIMSSTASFAADIPVRKEAPAPVLTSPAYAWTGLYLGADAGYSWGMFDGAVTAANGFGPPGAWRHSNNGRNFGVYTGYNMQFGSWVIGAEAEAQNAHSHGYLPNLNAHYYITESKWSGALRGRLGYALDRVLFYAAAGVARADTRIAFDFILNHPPAGVNNGNRNGWTIGAGLEYAICENIIGRTEYRYSDYGYKTLTNVALNYRERSHFTTSAVLVGLAYKFGGPEAIVAKY